MTLEEPRQGYFLGKIVRKAKRAVKKVVKSPLGKAALLGAGAYFAGGGGLPQFLGGKGLGGFKLGTLGSRLGFGSMKDGKQSFDSGQGFGINATTGGPVSNKTGRGRTDYMDGGLADLVDIYD